MQRSESAPSGLRKPRHPDLANDTPAYRPRRQARRRRTSSRNTVVLWLLR